MSNEKIIQDAREQFIKDKKEMEERRRRSNQERIYEQLKMNLNGLDFLENDLSWNLTEDGEMFGLFVVSKDIRIRGIESKTSYMRIVSQVESGVYLNTGKTCWREFTNLAGLAAALEAGGKDRDPQTPREPALDYEELSKEFIKRSNNTEGQHAQTLATIAQTYATLWVGQVMPEL